MGISYLNLRPEIRRLMVDEIRAGNHYVSPRLSVEGRLKWPTLLEEAAANLDDDWLAEQLLGLNFVQPQESYVRKETQRIRKVNQPQAAEQLAEGEFNRYYLRALCLHAATLGIGHLIVYRGKAVHSPRPESEAKIGTAVDVGTLLKELRRNDFVMIGEVLGVPGGPNSGITCKLP